MSLSQFHNTMDEPWMMNPFMSGNMSSSSPSSSSSMMMGNWPSMRSNFNMESMMMGMVDIRENDKCMEFCMDTPGMCTDDIHVSMSDGNMLHITGERRRDWEDKDKSTRFHRMERSHGRFSRTFRLPDNCDCQSIKANCDNGVLHIMVPKKMMSKESSMTKIPISSTPSMMQGMQSSMSGTQGVSHKK